MYTGYKIEKKEVCRVSGGGGTHGGWGPRQRQVS